MDFWCKIGLHKWRYKKYPISFSENRKCLKCGKHQSINLSISGNIFRIWKTLDKD